MIKSFFFILLLIFGYNELSGQADNLVKVDNHYSIDTLAGFFLYEANIPYVAHARDQIVQRSLIIKFDGVFLYLCSRSTRDNIKMNINLEYVDDESVISMLRELSYLGHDTDSNYLRTALSDKGKILMYKKFYAKFTCTHFGLSDFLVPKLEHYTCCYSHTKQKIDSYCILKVLEYKVY